LSRKINASRFTVTVSRFNREFMIEHLPRVDGQRIRLNYNGVDLEAFRAKTRPVYEKWTNEVGSDLVKSAEKIISGTK
jgi:hypothetical protein